MISGRKLSGPVISVIEALRSWKSVQVGPTAKRTLKRRRTDSSRGSGSRGPQARARAAKPQTLPSSAPPQAFAATPATQLVPEIPRTRSPPPRPPSSSRSVRASILALYGVSAAAEVLSSSGSSDHDEGQPRESAEQREASDAELCEQSDAELREQSDAERQEQSHAEQGHESGGDKEEESSGNLAAASLPRTPRATVDYGKALLVRDWGTHIEEATMEKGPNGWALARFGEEPPIQTEIPNALIYADVQALADARPLRTAEDKPVLAHVVEEVASSSAKPSGQACAHPVRKAGAKSKGKAGAKPKAKQAAKPQGSAAPSVMLDAAGSEEKKAESVAPAAPLTKKYYGNFYKNDSRYGIKRGWGKKEQIASFKAPPGVSAEECRQVQEELCAALARGACAESGAKAWLHTRFRLAS